MYFPLKLGAHIRGFGSTSEYFETAEYELQTPTKNIVLVTCSNISFSTNVYTFVEIVGGEWVRSLKGLYRTYSIRKQHWAMPKSTNVTKNIFVVVVWSSYYTVSKYSPVLQNHQIWAPKSNYKYFFYDGWVGFFLIKKTYLEEVLYNPFNAPLLGEKPISRVTQRWLYEQHLNQL